jgi:rhamnosyltransferase
MAHRDRNTGRDYHVRFDIIHEAPHWREVRTAITSGSLVRVAVFGAVGLFDDALFIDSVDHDFCLRCRRRGLLVIESRDQVLEHAIGQATVDRLLWREVTPAHHSPMRRYYITRNSLEMCRRYLFTDFIWTAEQLYLLGVGALAMLFLEDQRRAKTWAMLRGVRDFALRRFGPRQGASAAVSRVPGRSAPAR